MKPPFQSSQEVIISAPLETVWEYNQDLSKIPDYHPRVKRVEFVSDKKFRAPGVAYECHLNDGKNSCLERDIDIVPMEKIVTILPEDTMGLSKILKDYVVETTFEKMGQNKTKMKFFHYYSTPNIFIKFLNLVIKWKIGKQSQDTLNAIKAIIEKQEV